MGDESDAARLERTLVDRVVAECETRRRAVETVAHGPDQPYACLPCRSLDLLAEASPGFAAGFGEAPDRDDRNLRAVRAERFDCAGTLRCRNGDESDVHRLRELGDRPARGHRADRLAAPIDRVHPAVVSGRDDIAHRLSGLLGRIRARADERDGLRPQQHIDRFARTRRRCR